jgi:hypothetical protein
MHGDLTTVPVFKRALRGYDPAEVHAWAAQAAATTQELVRTMRSAHLMAERIVEETEEEAARRRSAAVAEADRMLAVARHEAHEVVAVARDEARRELAALEAERDSVVAELAHLRGLLHDERVRARDGLAAALHALDEALGRHDRNRSAMDVDVVEHRPALAVVAS